MAGYNAGDHIIIKQPCTHSQTRFNESPSEHQMFIVLNYKAIQLEGHTFSDLY